MAMIINVAMMNTMAVVIDARPLSKPVARPRSPTRAGRSQSLSRGRLESTQAAARARNGPRFDCFAPRQEAGSGNQAGFRRPERSCDSAAVSGGSRSVLLFPKPRFTLHTAPLHGIGSQTGDHRVAES